MNKEDIIRMAREAATEDGSVKRADGKNVVIYAAKTNRFLERFAALVAAHEREACAKVCEEGGKDESGRIHVQAWGCAKDIRARGQE